MKLFRLCVEQVRPGEALPWNVRNEPGQLLLSKGYVIKDTDQALTLIERGVFVDQEEFDQHQQSLAPVKPPLLDPTHLWTQLNSQVHALLTNPQDHPAFQSDVQGASGHIQHALRSDPESVVFEMLSGEPQSNAVAHSVNTAFVAALTANRFGWSESEQATLTNAALTMNMAALALHNMLSTQRTALTPEQRCELHDHPAHSRALLEASGVTDADWLRTVEQHHITPDGRGLPQERGHLSEQACMIHYADVYMAKLSARAYRGALPAHQAARELFINGGGTQNPFVSTLIKEIGMYPPGSFVQLANGDTAVVLKRGEGAHIPQVRSLLNGRGAPYPEPEVRDTAQAAFKVVTGLPRGQVKTKLDRRKIYASARA